MRTIQIELLMGAKGSIETLGRREGRKTHMQSFQMARLYQGPDCIVTQGGHFHDAYGGKEVGQLLGDCTVSSMPESLEHGHGHGSVAGDDAQCDELGPQFLQPSSPC